MSVTTVPALSVKVACLFRTPVSAFCAVQGSSIWFPVPIGTVSLPPAPTRILNPDWLPPNAAPIPGDWDRLDMCRLFQDILPVQVGPVYAVALDPAYTLKPYREAFPVYAAVRTTVKAEYWPYALSVETRECVLRVKTFLGDPRKFPTEVALALHSNIEVESEYTPWQFAHLAIKSGLSVLSAPPTASPSVLLHMDGVNGSTNFVDEMGNTWTSQFASISYDKQIIGASVGKFTTPNSSISCSNPDLALGTLDFTIDFWIYPTIEKYGRQTIFSAGTEALMSMDYGLHIDSQRYLYIGYRSSSSNQYGNYNYCGDLGLPFDDWIHVAVSRKNALVRVFVNGVLQNTLNVSSSAICGIQNLKIGSSTLPSEYYTGYIDEFRLIKGVGLYTSSFTPSTQPHDPPPSLKLVRLTVKAAVAGEFAYGNRASQTQLTLKVVAFFTTGYNFKPNVYAGNGTTTTVSGLGFKPSFVWIKSYTYDEYGLFSFDRLRGVNRGAHFHGSYYDDAFPSQTLTQFTQDGFVLGNSLIVNRSGYNFSAWAFGGNESSPVTIAKETVADGFIAACQAVTVEQDAISYGYYESNGTTSSSTGQGSYFYHGFDSEPDLVFITSIEGINFSRITCRMVGKTIGYRMQAEVTNTAFLNYSSIPNIVYYWNPSRPKYVRVAAELDGNNIKKYAYYAFKSKPGVLKIEVYAGSTTEDIRVELGWRPAMLMFKTLLSANNSGGMPVYVFSATHPWNTAVPMSRYGGETVTQAPVVDATGFTIPKNSTISADGRTYLYMAVAGSLVSPLQFSSANPTSTVISATAHAPTVQLTTGVELEVPATSVTLQSNEPAIQITPGGSVDIPAQEIFVTVSIPEINPNTTLDIPSVDSVVATWIPDYVGEFATSVAVPSSVSNLTAHVPAVSVIDPTSGLYLFPLDPLYLFDQYE